MSKAVVLDLALSLSTRFPRSRPFYVLHIDNFFTTQRLYQELYKQGIGANGTTKAGSGIPKELCYLRDTLRKQNDHGAWYNYVVESVNCIAFCDMASNLLRIGCVSVASHRLLLPTAACFVCYSVHCCLEEPR
jgi:Transposase IS4